MVRGLRSLSDEEDTRSVSETSTAHDEHARSENGILDQRRGGQLGRFDRDLRHCRGDAGVAPVDTEDATGLAVEVDRDHRIRGPLSSFSQHRDSRAPV